MQSDNLKIGIGYAAICLLWGSTWIAIKIGLESLTPFLSSGVRFIIAAALIFAVAKFKKLSFQTDQKSIRLYFILTLFSFVIPFGLVYWAQQFVPSGLSSILFAVFPFFVIIFSWIAIPKDRIGPYQLTGVVMGFVGIVVIFSENISFDLSDSLIGMIAIVSSAAMQGGVAVVIKKHGGELNPFTMNLIPLFFAGIFLTAGAFVFEDMAHVDFNSEAVLSLVYLASFGTLGTFTIYYWLMKKINVVILSLSAFITPIVAVVLGWIFLSEVLSARDFIGSSMVLIGILFANFRGLRNYFKYRKILK
ncbi:MAG: EamA family transporter [Melioribacteraceae bacterium]|nr:EamA family transporter [Melioribacteraceae bacterium]MCF8353969.1 EamA family transporter [Melioribacteraceae bacterium]MCF8393697.1 EamA family transporter [Melioribacteraceae bacterium]MCF8419561.1 EamA family transporter [Melioribacteraceae bacterium]